MESLQVVILAAGEATRFKSKINKVMHPLCGRPMIDYVVDLARSMKPKKICIVVGNDKERLQEHFKGQKEILFAHQKERLGTAHAVQVGLQTLKPQGGKILILNGDVPLLQKNTLQELLKKSNVSPLVLLTAIATQPYGYGRIIRDAEGKLVDIIEELNATETERQINEINAGIYIIDNNWLKGSLNKISKDPIKKEFYFTKLVSLAHAEGWNANAHLVREFYEILGANTRTELVYLEQWLQQKIILRHLAAGVTIQNPQTTYIESSVRIHPDSFLETSVRLSGNTQIGEGSLIETGCVIKNSKIGNQVQLKAYSYLEDAVIGAESVIGPFARIRPGTKLANHVRIGNFVELKKSKIGKGSKANHLSYIGDAVIGSNVNIGAGTITCNYDGKKKSSTHIADNVFIGSDTQLIAPVRIGKGAYVGAGTTVTKNVPAGTLTVSRVEQKSLKRKK